MATAQAVPGSGTEGTGRVYPVHVWAGPDARASRGLWLVKWLLLVPHLVVLALLWVAFLVLSIVAFVAILVTGRYPRWAFDFNVGVLRWSWRVAYYGYAALATDQYPPFTLDEVPDYPAHLDVDYPERLSRGLVLVKWWLLAIPHYIVVAILVGGGTWWLASADGGWRLTWGGGLVGILGAVAAVALLFTGRYPSSVYELLLGLNRWVLRVAAYVALMTDTYPPFRLDLGPEEPGRVRVSGGTQDAPPAAAVAPAPPVAAPSPGGQAGWTAGRVLSVVAGGVAGMLALALVTGGVAMLVADTAWRDGAGYVTTVERPLSSDGYAVSITSMTIEASPGRADVPAAVLGDVRLRVTPSDPGRAVFVGIAPSADVARYLGGVARTVPDAAWLRGTDVAGTAPSAPPASQGIWAAKAVGAGTQELVWSPRAGDWGVVVMNADASAGVEVTSSVGARLPWLGPTGAGLLMLGLAFLGAGVVSVAVAAHRARTTRTAASVG